MLCFHICLNTSLAQVAEAKLDIQKQNELTELCNSDPHLAIARIDRDLNAREQFSQDALARLHYLKAKALYRISKFGESAINYKESAAHFMQEGDTTNNVKARLGYSLCNYQLSLYAQSAEEAYECLRAAKQLRDTAIITIALNQLGNIEYKRKAFKRALAHFEQALALKQNSGAANNISDLLVNIGNVHFEMEAYKLAEEKYHEALVLDSVLGDPLFLAADYNNLGTTKKRLGEFDHAIQLQKASLQLNKQVNNASGIASNYNNLASTYVKLKEWRMAERYSDSALALADSFDLQRIRMDVTENLVEIYQQTDRSKESFEALNQLLDLKDEEFDRLTTSSIAQLGALYDLRTKEEEIDRLQQKEELNEAQLQNTRLLLASSTLGLIAFSIILISILRSRQIKKQHRLELQLQEHQIKALQLQMNPHFLFNTLGGIGHFISSHNPREALKYLSKFSTVVRGFLDSSNIPSTSVETESQRLKHYLELERLRSEGAFDFEIRIAEGCEMKEMPTMVIQPFVENAVIHGVHASNQKDAMITVRFKQENQNLVCEVQDNGKGFEPWTISQEKGKHQSLGIQLIQKRLKLLHQKTGKTHSVSIINLKAEGKSGTLVQLKLGTGKA